MIVHSQKNYLSAKDLVAQGLFVSENAVRIAVCKGKLPSFKIGRRLLFTQELIETYLSENRRKSKDELEGIAETLLYKKGVGNG